MATSLEYITGDKVHKASNLTGNQVDITIDGTYVSVYTYISVRLDVKYLKNDACHVFLISRHVLLC